MRRRIVSTFLGIIVVVLIVALGAYYVRNGSILPNRTIKDSGSNISDYSAVFLTNGQVYFGKINSNSSADELNLSDIYYLQVNQNIQNSGSSTSSGSTDTNANNIVLVKLGQELHGPNDLMHINRQQILFTESLKNDSKVISAINTYQKK